MSLTIFSQRDPQWSGLPLGESDLTIGAYGCYVTTDAMILGQIPGVAITPKNLNDKLRELNRFSGALLSSDAAIDGLYGARYVETKWEPNQADLTYPRDEVTEQYAIEIFIQGDASRVHFVLYYDGHTPESLRVVDPWNGDICLLRERYGDPGTIIQKWVHYTIPGTPVAPPPPVPAQGTPPQVVAPEPPVVETPEPVPAPAQPSESVLNNEPEYKATYQIDRYEVTTTVDGFAIDMTSQAGPISIAANTLIEVEGIFTDNGRSYVRSKKSVTYDDAHGTWYGLSTDIFATGQVPDAIIPVRVEKNTALAASKLLASLLAPLVKVVKLLKGLIHA